MSLLVVDGLAPYKLFSVAYPLLLLHCSPLETLCMHADLKLNPKKEKPLIENVCKQMLMRISQKHNSIKQN